MSWGPKTKCLPLSREVQINAGVNRVWRQCLDLPQVPLQMPVFNLKLVNHGVSCRKVAVRRRAHSRVSSSVVAGSVYLVYLFAQFI